MAFNPSALNERTLKQFVDRLLAARQKQPIPTIEQWPPKRSQIQEEIAAVLGFSSWHAAIGAVRAGRHGDGKTTAMAQDPSDRAKGGFSLPMWPEEPARCAYEDYNRMIAWAAAQGASDITITTGKPIEAEYIGRRFTITARSLSMEEVEEVVRGLSDGNLPASSIDVAHKVQGMTTGTSHRFHVNATTIRQDGRRGWQVTCRAIASRPPSMKDIGAEDLARHLDNSKAGAIIVSGRTGSGKSTSIAAIVRKMAEEGGGKTLTYESPIEYVYDDIPDVSIAQHEVGRDVVSFPEGIRNALRRNPSIIVVGECRDAETTEEAIRAANSGHTIVMGAQTQGVADTIVRLIKGLHSHNRTGKLDFIQGVSIVTSQMLVPTTQGTRVALRETLVFDDEVVQRLWNIDTDNIRQEVRAILGERGEGFLADASTKLKSGVISQKTWLWVERMTE